MGNTVSLKRLSFLLKKYNILSNVDLSDETYKNENNIERLYELKNDKGELLGVYEKAISKESNDIRIFNIRLCENVFSNMVEHDPTKKKVYTQWMLNVMTRFIRDNKIDLAIRFNDEDLKHSEKYLRLFDKHKRTLMFKKLCKKNEYLRDIDNPCDINQYHNFSQIYHSIDNYIERNLSKLEIDINQYVKLGEAIIPIKTDDYTLYIPLTIKASVIFSNFVNWCTARSGNSNFKTYTAQKTPFGDNSRLYIIINNNFFLEQTNPRFSNEIFQIHFESSQIMNRSNSPELRLKEIIFKKSSELDIYFHKLLLKFAIKNSKFEDNVYLKYLISFGHEDAIFKVIKKDTPTIKFINTRIIRIPSLTSFNNLSGLFITNCLVEDFSNDIGNVVTLNLIALSKNKIKRLPESMGKLKNLKLLNLHDNQLSELPKSFSNLDISNGGNLIRLILSKNNFSDKEIGNISKMLPNTEIIYKNEIK